LESKAEPNARPPIAVAPFPSPSSSSPSQLDSLAMLARMETGE